MGDILKFLLSAFYASSKSPLNKKKKKQATSDYMKKNFNI